MPEDALVPVKKFTCGKNCCQFPESTETTKNSKQVLVPDDSLFANPEKRDCEYEVEKI